MTRFANEGAMLSLTRVHLRGRRETGYGSSLSAGQGSSRKTAVCDVRGGTPAVARHGDRRAAFIGGVLASTGAFVVEMQAERRSPSRKSRLQPNKRQEQRRSVLASCSSSGHPRSVARRSGLTTAAPKPVESLRRRLSDESSILSASTNFVGSESSGAGVRVAQRGEAPRGRVRRRIQCQTGETPALQNAAKARSFSGCRRVNAGLDPQEEARVAVTRRGLRVRHVDGRDRRERPAFVSTDERRGGDGPADEELHARLSPIWAAKYLRRRVAAPVASNSARAGINPGRRSSVLTHRRPAAPGTTKTSTHSLEDSRSTTSPEVLALETQPAASSGAAGTYARAGVRRSTRMRMAALKASLAARGPRG